MSVNQLRKIDLPSKRESATKELENYWTTLDIRDDYTYDDFYIEKVECHTELVYGEEFVGYETRGYSNRLRQRVSARVVVTDLIWQGDFPLSELDDKTVEDWASNWGHDYHSVGNYGESWVDCTGKDPREGRRLYKTFETENGEVAVWV